jgi:hypothetical protein
MLKKINIELDKILNVKNWTEKEHDLYILLETKIEKYTQQAQKYKLNNYDKEKIIENFTNQKWFFTNPNFNKLLNTLYIEDYKSTINNNLNLLYVKLKFKTFYMIIFFKNEKSKFEQKISIYNGFYNYDILYSNQNKIDYDIVRKIITINMESFENIELYRFIKEIILYFDTNYDIKFEQPS